MDIFDNAQEAEAKHRNQSLAALKAKIGASRLMQSRQECLACGESIPEPRRAACSGCTLCITCQQAFEKDDI